MTLTLQEHIHQCVTCQDYKPCEINEAIRVFAPGPTKFTPISSQLVPEGAAPRAEGRREHLTDEADPLACWCQPYRDTEEPEVIIHRKEGEA